jgi:hypothetical protein
MPNTFAHIGLQGPLTRAAFGPVEPRWIYLGLLVPDLPWITLRAAAVLGPPLDPYDVRLYAIAQSSLLASMIACGAFALLSAEPRKVLAILGFNTFVHLILDATQIKWGSGVHLLAPVSWTMLRIDLFDQESIPTYLLTLAGFAFAVWAWPRAKSREIPLARPAAARGRYAAAAALMVAYLTLPAFLAAGPEAADAHSVRVLRNRMTRTGQEVAFDRTSLVHDSTGAPHIHTFAGERIPLVGVVPAADARISLRGVFLDSDTLRILEVHDHGRWPRQQLSLLGVLFIVGVWGRGRQRSAPSSNRQAAA